MFLVTGASGNVGAEVIRALADDGEQVRGLVREVSEAALPEGVEPVAGDLDDPGSLAAALDGVRAAFLLPGYRDMPGLVAACEDAGVTRVVLLSGGSAGSGDLGNAISAYMIRSEDAVRESALEWTILRPYGFMSNTLRWLSQLESGDVVREPFAEVPIAMIDPADIGAVAALALRHGGEREQVHVLTGPQPLLPRDRLRLLGDALGRDLRLEPLSDAEARERMIEEMPVAYVDAFFDFYVEGALDESTPLPTVEQILGRAPGTFSQWLDEHLEAFRLPNDPRR
jgi:uncharacterized protein YbjT (DUF2867 family)